MFKDENRHYSLRKLSVGLASVLIGISFVSSMNGNNVKADTVNAQASAIETKTSENKVNTNADATTEVAKSTNSVDSNKITPSQTVLNKQAASNDLLKGTSDQNSVTEQNNLLDDLGKQKASTENNQAEAKNQENRLVDQINYKLTNNTSTDNKKDLGQNKVAPDETKQAPTTKFDAEKSTAQSSSVQQANQSSDYAENNSQAQPQNTQKLDITKNSKKLDEKALATNLIETNNKLTYSYTKQGSDPSVVKVPPKSLLASDNFDYSGTTTVKWSDKMTEGVADNIPAYMVNRSDKSFVSAYSQTNVDGIIAVATTTFDGNNYIVDPNTGKQTRIAKMNRVFYDLKDVNHILDLPLQVNIFTDPSRIFRDLYINGGADQLSEYVEYLDNQGNKINIPLAYDIQIITSLDGNTNQNERVSGTNGSIVYPYNSNTNFLNNDPSTNTVIGYDANNHGGEALAIGGLNNGLTFSTTTDWGGDQWTMGLATSDQLKNLPYSEIDTRGISRNIHFVDENGNQIQPTLTQTASWVSAKDKQGNIQTIGNQPNIAEYNIPHELTANGKTYLIDAFTDGNSTKLASWTPANTDKNQDVYLVYKNVVDRHYRIVEKTPDGQSKILYDLISHWEPTSNGYSVPSTDDFTVLATSNNVQQVKDSNGVGDLSYLTITPDKFDNYNVKLESAMYYENGVGFYYDNNLKKYVFDVQAGATSYKTIQSDTDFIIAYTKNITDPSQLQTTGKRTITITLPHKNKTMTIIQTVGYKRTGTFDTYTKQSTYTDWVFDADTSNVTVDGQPSTQYQAYILKDGVVNYAPIKLPHINGYKAKLIKDNANPAMFMVSFVALPEQNNQSNNVQSSQKTIQDSQKPVEPAQTAPADQQEEKEVAQILDHITHELMNDDADSFEPAQTDSAPLETADVTQKVTPKPAKPAPIETQVPVGTHDSLSNYTLTTNNPILDTRVFNNIESNGLTWQIVNKNLNSNVSYNLTNTIYKLRLPKFNNYELHLVKRGTTQDSVSFVYTNKSKQLNYVFNLKIQGNKYYLTVGKINRVNRKIFPIKTYNVISYQALLDIFDKYFK